MIVSRQEDAELVFASPETPLNGIQQIVVNTGDCCLVFVNGRLMGRVEPGRWMIQHLPFSAQLLNGFTQAADFFFVYTGPYRSVKMGTSLGGGRQLFFEATVVVHDPAKLCQGLIGSGDPSGAVGYLAKQILQALKLEVQRTLATNPDAMGSSQQAWSQAVANKVASSFGDIGVTFTQLNEVKVIGGPGAQGQGAQGAGAASVPNAPQDGRVQLLGKLAGKVTAPVADDNIAKWERFGLFVAADPLAIRYYSGAVLGWRWLARGAGSMMEHTEGWPFAPNYSTEYHFPSEEEARAYYGALRQHAMATWPGLQAQDNRQGYELNSPNSWAETFWINGQDVLYLLYDNVEDMQALSHETETIGIYPAAPQSPSPPLVAFESTSDTHYVGVARGPSGAADHVLIVHSDRHAPVPIITDGLPRAEWIEKFEDAGLEFAGNLLVLLWGRFSGADILGSEHAADPIASLTAKIGDAVGVALPVSHEAASRLGDAAAGYAIRLEPGTYSLHYYELHTDEHGDFHCCALSRDGAESFMPVTVGNAGGVRFGGLSVEQYAMLSVERDNLLMQMGPQACFTPQMANLCQRYGIPYVQSGMAARIDEWEQYIANDAAFSAQWVTHRSMATMKLQGHPLDPQQMAAMAQQQNHIQQAVEQHAAHLDAIRDAAIQLIAMSAGRSPDEVIAMARQSYPQLDPQDVLHKARRILLEPEEYGPSPNVEACTEPLVRAYYRLMPAEDQRSEGSEDSYFKESRSRIFPRHGLAVPGLFNKIFG